MEIYWMAGVLGFLTAFVGLLMGGFAALGTQNYGKRFEGGLMGFTGGILIAFVCFELLPNAFEENRFYSVIFGMLIGVFLTAFLEGKMESKAGMQKAGALISMGVFIHNIPEGMAIGSLFSVTALEGVRLAIIIALHCIPEGLTMGLALKGKKKGFLSLFFSFLLLSVSMGIGSSLGAMASSISPDILALCFSFAGGVMLYITCGEIIPESKEIWKGRITTIGSLMGFLLGVAIISGV